MKEWLSWQGGNPFALSGWNSGFSPEVTYKYGHKVPQKQHDYKKCFFLVSWFFKPIGCNLLHGNSWIKKSKSTSLNQFKLLPLARIASHSACVTELGLFYTTPT
jgi:hypothetical protein